MAPNRRQAASSGPERIDLLAPVRALSLFCASCQSGESGWLSNSKPAERLDCPGFDGDSFCWE
jgi:hypothetical protein